MLDRFARGGLWVALALALFPRSANAQSGAGSVHVALAPNAGAGIAIGSLGAIQASVVNLFGETAKTSQAVSPAAGITVDGVPAGSTYHVFITAIVNGHYLCSGSTDPEVPFIVSPDLTTNVSAVLDDCQEGFGTVSASIPAQTASPYDALRLNYQVINEAGERSGWLPWSDTNAPVLLGARQGGGYRLSISANDGQVFCSATSEEFTVGAGSNSPLSVPICCAGNVPYGNLSMNLLPPNGATLVSAHYTVRNQVLGYTTTHDASGSLSTSGPSAFFCGLPAGSGWEVFVSAIVSGGACGRATGSMGLGLEPGNTVSAFLLLDCPPPGPACGNGAKDFDEACDDGALNGSTDSCCSTACQFQANGTACSGRGNTCAPAQPDACLSGVCIAAACASQNAVASGVVSTGGTATPAEPVQTTVTTPTGGVVSITQGAVSSPPPVGYSFVGERVTVQAPDASTVAPMDLVFDVDAASVPLGTLPSAVGLWGNGVQVPECTGPGPAATPDPCRSSETTPGGDVRIRVRTSRASTFAFTTALPSVPALGTWATAGLATLLGAVALFSLSRRRLAPRAVAR